MDQGSGVATACGADRRLSQQDRAGRDDDHRLQRPVRRLVGCHLERCPKAVLVLQRPVTDAVSWLSLPCQAAISRSCVWIGAV